MSQHPNIIIICEDRKTCQLLTSCLTDLFDLTIIGYNTNPATYYDATKSQLLVLVAHPPPTYALKKLRELTIDKHIPPIFLISEKWDYPSFVTAHRFGVIDFLELPIRPSELLSRLHAYFSKAGLAKGDFEKTKNILPLFLKKLSKKIFQANSNIIHPCFIAVSYTHLTLPTICSV